jgi:hypothetical protein
VKWFQLMPFETKDLRHLGQLKLKALAADQKNGIAQRKDIHIGALGVPFARAEKCATGNQPTKMTKNRYSRPRQAAQCWW